MCWMRDSMSGVNEVVWEREQEAREDKGDDGRG